ncbi:MAG: LacI family DNA-binding transcriptional regulator [Paracoccaceae bacterium]
MKRQGTPSATLISELAGVSKSTVSRALAGNPSISEATRKRILKIAAEVGYEPNAMASSLVTMKSGVLGFVIASMENPFYQEHIERIARLSAEAGHQLMLFQVSATGDLLDVVPAMARYRLRGAIVIASVNSSDKALEQCHRHGIPVVLINRLANDGHTSSVLCNNEAGARVMARYLIEGGHRRIAVLSGREGSIVNRDRLIGLRAVLAEHGLTEVAELKGEFIFDKAYQVTRDYLKARPDVDAIFAVSDLMACGAMDAARDEGIRVPQDLSIVGFDGIRPASWPAYRLTTVEQPAEEMLKRAIELAARPDTGDVPSAEVVYINGRLKIRASARKPAAS